MAIAYVLVLLTSYAAGRYFALRRDRRPLTIRSFVSQQVPSVRRVVNDFRVNGTSALLHADTVFLSLSYILFIGFFVVAAILLLIGKVAA